jgi:hypothetical protein
VKSSPMTVENRKYAATIAQSIGEIFIWQRGV